MRNGSERGIAKLRQPVKPVPSAVNVEAAGRLNNYGNGGLKLEAGHDAAIEGAIVATILGTGLFIDHATGVVIGETAEVGEDVTIYHGVTLGGSGRDTGKRHPTIGDRVIIGAGAKVLGAIKVGDDSRIGANAVVVKEVPSSAVVVGVPGQAISRHGPDGEDSSLPDLVGISLQSLLTRVARLESQDDTPQTGRVIRPPEAGVWHGEDFSI